MAIEDAEPLLEIVELIGRINRQCGGLSEAQFAPDVDVQDSTAYRLIAIGEAAKALSSAFKGRHLKLPWRSIVSMRNLLAHECFVRESSIIWQTVATGLAGLDAECRAELDRLGVPRSCDPPLDGLCIAPARTPTARGVRYVMTLVMSGPTTAQFEPATARGKKRMDGPRAECAHYDVARDRLIVRLTTGVEFGFAPADAEGLQHASSDDVAHIDVEAFGLGIHFPRLDADL